MIGDFSAPAKVMGFAKGSTHPTRWVALIVLFYVTAPFVGQISMMVARAGPGEMPHEASFLVEDNFGDQQYSSGKVIKSFFHHQYNDILFGLSEINRKLGPSEYFFLDRNDANLVLRLLADGSQPETPVSYVCAFKEGEQVLLSYFLKRSPPQPWWRTW